MKKLFILPFFSFLITVQEPKITLDYVWFCKFEGTKSRKYIK